MDQIGIDPLYPHRAGGTGRPERAFPRAHTCARPINAAAIPGDAATETQGPPGILSGPPGRI